MPTTAWQQYIQRISITKLTFWRFNYSPACQIIHCNKFFMENIFAISWEIKFFYGKYFFYESTLFFVDTWRRQLSGNLRVAILGPSFAMCPCSPVGCGLLSYQLYHWWIARGQKKNLNLSPDSCPSFSTLENKQERLSPIFFPGERQKGNKISPLTPVQVSIPYKARSVSPLDRFFWRSSRSSSFPEIA